MFSLSNEYIKTFNSVSDASRYIDGNTKYTSCISKCCKGKLKTIKEKVEELAEVIIDEKWTEVMKTIKKVTDWQDKTQQTITKIETEFETIKKDFDNLHKAIIGKIGDYDQNILNVGTEIKAMEQVFKKLLPSFTENVGELSRITKKLKPKKPLKK